MDVTKNVKEDNIVVYMGSRDKLTNKMHRKSYIWACDNEKNQATGKLFVACGIGESFTISWL